MKDNTVEEILLSLIKGKDPCTGKDIKIGSAILEPEIQNTLNTILGEIKKYNVRKLNLPANTGKSWSKDEDEKIRFYYESKFSVDQIAQNLKRTRGAIYARLAYLGIENKYK